MERTIKNSILWIAVAALLFTAAFGFMSTISAHAADFSDINGHWAAGHIQAGINRGYINGYSDGTFKPENTISRSEFVKMINTAKGYTELTNLTFRDVVTTEWYYPEVQKAVKAGYITGYGNTFGPANQITREEAAVMLTRIAPGGTTSSLAGVGDVNAISSWALDAVKQAYGSGYLNGFDDGKFYPQSPLKRAEAVKILNKVLGIQVQDPPAQTGVTATVTISDIDEDTALMKLTSNVVGTLHWVLLEGSSSATPSADQVYNKRTDSNGTPEQSGAVNASANVAVNVDLKSMKENQSYKVAVVARDAGGKMSAVATRTFTTGTPASSGSNWLTTFKSTGTESSSIDFEAYSTVKGDLYWVLVEGSSAKTPSQANIKKGKDADGKTPENNNSFQVSAKTTYERSITGLSANTNYKLFACVYDSSNDYSSVKTISFKTSASNPNDWITTLNVNRDTGKVTCKSSKSGTLYYMLTPKGTSVSRNQLISSASAPSNLVDSNNFQITTSQNTFDLANLVNGTSYRLTAVVKNGSNYSNLRTTEFTAGSGSGGNGALSTLALVAVVNGKDVTLGSGHNFSFRPAQDTYSIELPAGTTGLKIKATTSSKDAKLYIAKNLETSGREVNLSLSEVTPEFVILVADGNAQKEYTIKTTAKEPGLTSLSLSPKKTFEPGFSQNVTSYNATVNVTSPEVTVKAVEGATLEISDGRGNTYTPKNDRFLVQDIETGQSVTVTIVVHAGDQLKSYTLTIVGE